MAHGQGAADCLLTIAGSVLVLCSLMGAANRLAVRPGACNAVLHLNVSH